MPLDVAVPYTFTCYQLFLFYSPSVTSKRATLSHASELTRLQDDRLVDENALCATRCRSDGIIFAAFE